ncbi:hypothetical protein Tco_1284112 [Tanacetum coccineum]
METIGIPSDKHETDENEEGKPLLAGKSSEVSTELFQKAHLYVIQNTDEIVPYIERHKQVLKTENLGKRIAFLENEHSKSFAKWLRKEKLLSLSRSSVRRRCSNFYSVCNVAAAGIQEFIYLRWNFHEHNIPELSIALTPIMSSS